MTRYRHGVLRQFVRGILIALLLSAFTLPRLHSQEDSKEVVKKQILERWVKMEQAVRSARFSWEEHRVQPKGSISKAFGKIANIQGEVPPRDQEFTAKTSASFTNEKLSFEQDYKNWSTAKNALLPDPYKLVFDGKITTDLHEIGGLDWPQGTKRFESSSRKIVETHLRPLMLGLRPLHNQHGMLTKDDFDVVSKAMLENTKCWVLEQKNIGNGAAKQFWVDPRQGWAIVRMTHSDQGATTIVIEIEYKKIEKEQFMPIAWTTRHSLQDGSVLETMRATVTNSVLNPLLEPAAFELSFPAGTRVVDMTTKPETNYIIRADKSKRMILDEDLGATYEQMLKTEPGKALRDAAPAKTK